MIIPSDLPFCYSFISRFGPVQEYSKFGHSLVGLNYYTLGPRSVGRLTEVVTSSN